MNIDMKKMWKKLIVALSSFGLLSTFGYYLINVENKALGKSEQSPSTIQKQIIKQDKKPEQIIGTVINVVDGDTIKVQEQKKDGISGNVITVRMLGIDTPETSHSPRAQVRGVADCFANEARFG